MMAASIACQTATDPGLAAMCHAATLSVGVELKLYQEERLSRVWEIARTAPAYRELPPFSESAFANLPFIPKSKFKENPYLFDTELAAKATKYYESSGTTGAPTHTYRTPEDTLWNYASVHLRWGELITSFDRCLILLPSDIVAIGDLISGVCELSEACAVRSFPFAQGIASWDRIAAIVESFRPTVLFGSPGTLIQMMRVYKNRGTFATISKPLQKLMLSGEVVSPFLQKALAREWDAEALVASYGSTETGTIAAVGGDRALRLLEYSYICEILTDQGLCAAAPGRAGRLVISTLNAFARPLLRFDTGDHVVVRACKDSQFLNLEILGREEEGVQIGERKFMTGEIETIVYGVDGLTGYQLQIHQDQVIGLVLELDPDWRGRAQVVLAAARSALHDRGISLDLSLVEQLPVTTKSGASLKSWKRSHAVAV